MKPGRVQTDTTELCPISHIMSNIFSAILKPDTDQNVAFVVPVGPGTYQKIKFWVFIFEYGRILNVRIRTIHIGFWPFRHGISAPMYLAPAAAYYSFVPHCGRPSIIRREKSRSGFGKKFSSFVHRSLQAATYWGSRYGKTTLHYITVSTF